MRAKAFRFINGILLYVLVCVGLDLFLTTWAIVGPMGIFRLISLVYLSNFAAGPMVATGYSIYRIRKRREYCRSAGMMAVSLLLFSLFVYSTFVEPRSVRVEEFKVPSDKLGGNFTIAHISDIQSEDIGSYERKIIEKLEEINPDIIFHTGDLLQIRDIETHIKELMKLAELFRGLSPKYGIYNVQGNLDSLAMLKAFDAASGVRTLVDRSVVIETEGGAVDILGLSFSKSMKGAEERVAKWLDGGDNGFKIVSGHAPDYVPDLTDLDIDLCLAGHTHGGQIRIPFFGPLLNASKVPKEWASGLRKVGRTHLNVSSGLGTEHDAGLVPMRFNCPPSITVIRVGRDLKE